MPKMNRIIDCSQHLYHNAPRYIGNPALEYCPHYYFMQQNQSNVEFLRMTTHTGTHLDVPYHIVEGGKRIGDFALETFMGDAIILNVSERVEQAISSDELKPRYDNKIKENDIVLIYTGWGQRRGYTNEWLKDFPFLTPECALWLSEKKLKGIGIDTVGFESYPPTPNLPVHHALLSAGFWLVEELYLPEEVLDKERWWFMALPWRLEDASGTPTRAVLIEWEE